jgi:hypothetical protein
MSSTDLRRNADGQQVLAPTFEDTGGLQPQWVGYTYTVTADATNIFDELVTTEKLLRGGWYELLDNDAVLGDYIEFAIVDKDDVLGLFESLDLEIGVDVLELKKYVKTEYVNPAGAHERQMFMAKSTTPILAGLYLRTIYESVGSVDVSFKVVTFAYE